MLSTLHLIYNYSPTMSPLFVFISQSDKVYLPITPCSRKHAYPVSYNFECLRTSCFSQIWKTWLTMQCFHHNHFLQTCEHILLIFGIWWCREKMQPLLIAIIIIIIIYFKYFIFGFISFSFHLKMQKKLSLHSGICFFLNIYWCIVIADSDTSISFTLEILFVQLFNASNLYRCAFLRLL